MAPSLKANRLNKHFSEMETMALPEQDNDKEDIWLEYAESVVKRRKPTYLSPPTLWKLI